MFKIKPETAELLAELLVKIIGETIRDRMIRSALVVTVAIGSQFITITKEKPDCGPPVKSSMQKVQTPH